MNDVARERQIELKANKPGPAPVLQDQASRAQASQAQVSTPLEQAELISKSLKSVSRGLRRPTMQWTVVLDKPVERLKSSFGAWVILSFVLFVILPAIVSGLYLALFASDQYASETRFAVRGGERGPMDMSAALTGAASGMRIQDSHIVADYVRGRGMVEELEANLKLRTMFSGPGVDFVFGFNPEKSIEKLVKYWWWQTDVSVDTMSGIITVIVKAFRPEDALAISQAIIVASERLVNELSERSRTDALKQAQSELSLAERQMQAKLRDMRELRDREGILDASKESDAMTRLIGEMRLELARLESEYATTRRNVVEDTPQVRVLEARIRSTRDQIRLMEARVTNAPNPAGAQGANRVLADSMSGFERLKLEQELAQKHYVEAAANLERARIDLATQQVYLATFLHPVLAQEALYPKRLWIFSAILAICLVLWGAGIGIAVLVRNHAA